MPLVSGKEVLQVQFPGGRGHPSLGNSPPSLSKLSPPYQDCFISHQPILRDTISLCREFLPVQFLDGRGLPPSLSQGTSAGSFFLLFFISSLLLFISCTYLYFLFPQFVSFQIIVSPLILPWKQIINKQSILSLSPHFQFLKSTNCCQDVLPVQFPGGRGHPPSPSPETSERYVLPLFSPSSHFFVLFCLFVCFPIPSPPALVQTKCNSHQPIVTNVISLCQEVLPDSRVKEDNLPAFLVIRSMIPFYTFLILYLFSPPCNPLPWSPIPKVTNYLSPAHCNRYQKSLPRILTSSIPWWKGTSSQSFSGNLCMILPLPPWMPLVAVSKGEQWR